jgi:hypothetical protein
MCMQTKFGAMAALLVAAVMFAAPARAQVRSSGASPIALNAVNFTLVGGSPNNPGSTGITATTTWLLRPNVNSLTLYAFFSSSTSALTDGAGHNIPSADFQISDNGGAFAALSNSVPFGGANAGLQVSSVRILGNNKTGTHSDLMTFNINLVPLTNLPTGVFTGTLTIQAQAF